MPTQEQIAAAAYAGAPATQTQRTDHAERSAEALYRGQPGPAPRPASPPARPAAPAPRQTLEQAAAAMYRRPEDAAPAPAPAAPTRAAPAAPAARAADPQPAAAADQQEHEEAAEAMYAAATTRTLVDWSEPGAKAADYVLSAPDTRTIDTSPDGKAAMARLRTSFEEAGAGRTLAREIFDDALRAGQAHQNGDTRISQTSAVADLRRELGSSYEKKVAAAQGLIQRASQANPDIIPFLERTGLGNNKEFILKVIAAAGRRR